VFDDWTDGKKTWTVREHFPYTKKIVKANDYLPRNTFRKRSLRTRDRHARPVDGVPKQKIKMKNRRTLREYLFRGSRVVMTRAVRSSVTFARDFIVTATITITTNQIVTSP